MKQNSKLAPLSELAIWLDVLRVPLPPHRLTNDLLPSSLLSHPTTYLQLPQTGKNNPPSVFISALIY